MNSLHSAASGSIPSGDLSALIAKLEAAATGSRALDGDVAWVFHPKLWGRRNPVNGQHQWMTEIDGKPRVLPRYTTSIDAALALAERVLPGWGFFLRKDRDGCNCGLVYPDASFVTPGCGSSPTPALALCAAILKAHASRTVEGE